MPPVNVADGTQPPPPAQPVPAQPDYQGGQPIYEAYTPPDAAADRLTPQETSTMYGGGQNVDTNVRGAETFLGDNRDLNSVSTGENSRANAERAIYDSMTSRLDPQFAQQGNDLEISLRNRGLSEGDAAYDSAMANFGREKTDAYKQANWQAIQGGGTEGQRDQQMDLDRRAQMFGEALGMSQQEIDKNRNALQAQAAQNQYSIGMGNLEQQQGQYDRMYDLNSQKQGYNQQMDNANYQNSLRQQQIQEEMLRRNQSLNEMNALLTGSQVGQPNFDDYNTAGRGNGTDYSGAADSQYQSSLDSFNAKNAMWQGFMGGGADLYGSGMFSDERLKDNLVKVDEYKGLSIYTWVWNKLMPEVAKRGTQGIGFIAQEVQKVIPHAIINDPSGFLKIDYDKVFKHG
jgi:hypothetical protein